MRNIVSYVVLAIMFFQPFIGAEESGLKSGVLAKGKNSLLKIQELEKMAADRKGSAAVLLYRKIAELHEDSGETDLRDTAYMQLLQQFDTIKKPAVEIKQAARIAREKTAESRYAEAVTITRLFSENDTIQKTEYSEKGISILNDLLSFYNSQEKHYSRLKERTNHYNFKYNLSLINQGKAHYLISCFYEDCEEEKTGESLEKALSFFNAVDSDVIDDIELHYYAGLIHEKNKNFQKAARCFEKCINFPVSDPNTEVIRDSYIHAVFNLSKSRYYSSCAETGLNYLYQFPIDPEHISIPEKRLCFYTASSLKSLNVLGGVSLKKVVRSGRTRVILEVRAQRASLGRAGGGLGMRTYPVYGSGGSSATIQLPSLGIQGVSGTVAVPCR